MSAGPAIELRELHKHYREGQVEEVHALRGIDLTNERGTELMRAWTDRALTLLARVPLTGLL